MKLYVKKIYIKYQFFLTFLYYFKFHLLFLFYYFYFYINKEFFFIKIFYFMNVRFIIFIFINNKIYNIIINLYVLLLKNYSKIINFIYKII